MSSSCSGSAASVATSTAVRAMTTAGFSVFQKKVKLVADGVVGPKTLGQARSTGTRSATSESWPRTRRVRRVAPTTSSRRATRSPRSRRATGRRWRGSRSRITDPRPDSSSSARACLPAESIAAPQSSLGGAPRLLGEVLRPRLPLVRALAWQESGLPAPRRLGRGGVRRMQVTEATWRFVEDVLLHGPVRGRSTGTSASGRSSSATSSTLQRRRAARPGRVLPGGEGGSRGRRVSAHRRYVANAGATARGV